jgi:sirohydrochlorin cobaltochelatase
LTRRALVLAAHGSRHESAVNDQIRRWAAALAASLDFDEVTPAFHQGEPGFHEVLDRLTAREVIVIPLMASSGYYCNAVLPRELAQNQRLDDLQLTVTLPLGLHPLVPRLVALRVAKLLGDFALHPARTAIVLVGHGTARHPASRDSTFALAAAIRESKTLLSRPDKVLADVRSTQSGDFPDVVCVFLDDDPPMDQALALTTKPNVVVVPFLIAPGPHATKDIPQRLGIDPAQGTAAPFAASVAGRRIVIDIPFGRYSEMIDLIATMAAEARSDAGASLSSATP